MHKKIIKGKPYYYTTFRDGDEHKTVYLGSDKDVAEAAEEQVKKESRPKRGKWLFFAFILLVCGLTFFLLKYHYTGSFFEPPYVGWVTGSASRDVADFSVEDELIKVNIKQREEFKRTLRVTNTGGKYLVFNVNSNLGSLLTIPDPTFVLPIGQTHDLGLSFYASPNVEPDVYVGKIFFTSESLQKATYTIIEIESIKVFYDVSVNIPIQFRNLEFGDDLVFNVRVYNFAKYPYDSTVFYEVKDFNGDVLYESSEKVHLESEVSFTKTVKLPENIKEGNYVMVVKVVGQDSVGTSAALFDIVKEHEESAFAFDTSNINGFMLIFILVLVTLIVIVVITTILEFRRFSYLESTRHMRPVAVPEQRNIIVRKRSGWAILMSAFADRIRRKPKIKVERKIIIRPKREVVVKPKIVKRGRSGISLFFRALASKLRRRPKSKVIVKVKKLPPKVVVKHEKPAGVTLFFRTLARKIRERPKVKREVVVKYKTLPPKVIVKHEEPKVIVKYKEVPSHEPKPSLLGGFFKKKPERVELPKPAKLPKHEKKVAPKPEVLKPELEFPHLKHEHFVTKQDMIEEGKELVELSKKHQPKVKAQKVGKVKKPRAYLSKGERDLLKQQELLKKKLEGLY